MLAAASLPLWLIRKRLWWRIRGGGRGGGRGGPGTARELGARPGSPPSTQVVLLSIKGEAGSCDPVLASPRHTAWHRSTESAESPGKEGGAVPVGQVKNGSSERSSNLPKATQLQTEPGLGRQFRMNPLSPRPCAYCCGFQGDSVKRARESRAHSSQPSTATTAINKLCDLGELVISSGASVLLSVKWMIQHFSTNVTRDHWWGGGR